MADLVARRVGTVSSLELATCRVEIVAQDGVARAAEHLLRPLVATANSNALRHVASGLASTAAMLNAGLAP